MGGGCYGTFYASQLAKAKARGKVDFRTVIVVDRNSDCRARRELGEAPDRRFVTQDWTSFFDAYLLDASDDHVVPSPHMPHLMFEWLLARARQRWPRRSITVDPVPGDIGTPYDRTAPDATRYVSFADWVCPTHCIEPVLCPAIGAPPTWEMGDRWRIACAGRVSPSLVLRCSSASTTCSASGRSPSKRCSRGIGWWPRRGCRASEPRCSWGRSRAVTGR